MDFEKNASILGIYDGHGGPLISKFVSQNFINLLMNMTSYQKKNYEQALMETFLKLDELLRLTKVNNLLREHQLQTLDNETLGCAFISIKDLLHYNNELDSTDHTSLRSNKSFENIVQLIQKDKILDLTEEETTNDQQKDKNQELNQHHHIKKKMVCEDNKMFINDNSHKLYCRMPHSSELNELVAKDMGTTANVLLIKNNYIYLANVGDSLSVMYKNGKAIPLNQEHKTTLLSESDRIIKSGTKIINNRVEGQLNLTRAIGDLAFKRNSNLKFFEQAVTAYPEITKIKLTPDIDFVVMGCDGVWDCVEPQKFCDHISSQLKKGNSINIILDEVFKEIISETNNGKHTQLTYFSLYNSSYWY